MLLNRSIQVSTALDKPGLHLQRQAVLAVQLNKL